jgi:hypothetical protein
MVRAKSGTRMSHISVMSEEKESSWITDHYNGFLDTTDEVLLDTILTETGSILQTELATSLEIDVSGGTSDTEIITISFVGDDRATPIQTVGEFKAT